MRLLTFVSRKRWLSQNAQSLHLTASGRAARQRREVHDSLLSAALPERQIDFRATTISVELKSNLLVAVIERQRFVGRLAPTVLAFSKAV